MMAVVLYRWLHRWAIAAQTVAAGAAVVCGGAALAVRRAARDVLVPRAVLAQPAVARFERWRTLDRVLSGSAVVLLVTSLIVFALLVMWTRQAHAESSDLWPGERRWSKGWAIGAWFFPLANLILPKLVLSEIEKIAVAPRVQRRVLFGWQGTSASLLGWSWWCVSVAGWMATRSLSAASQEIGPGATLSQVQDHYTSVIVSSILIAMGFGLGAVHVRRLTSALRRAQTPG